MNYWENRYKRGGTSGCGSIGDIRDWKWEIIRSYEPLTSVIDIGCGDMSFWEGQKLPGNYTGIDLSKTIIEKNKMRFPKGQFFVGSSDDVRVPAAQTVLCLDMLFHIMDTGVYLNTLESLCRISEKYIFIYTWVDNPIRKLIFFKVEKGDYEYFRNPSTIYNTMIKNGFGGGTTLRNTGIDPYGAMMIFVKEGSP